MALRELVPELAQRVSGACFRVPAPGGVSALDLTVRLGAPCELAKLKRALRDAAASPAYRGKLGYRDDAVGGGDFAADGR